MGSFSQDIQSLQNTYNNYSQGDTVIANSVSKKKYSSGSLANDIKKLQENDAINNTPEIVGTTNVIPVNRNDDNSIKVTFDNIYQDNDLAEVAKDFYYFRDGEKFENNKEAIDYYINDRTWKQANVVSIGKEYSYITGKDLKQDQLQRYAYLTKTWDDLPNMFQEGGGTASQRLLRFGKNLFYAIADPINIIGVGIGGQLAKGAAKKAAAESIKHLTQKQFAKQMAEGTIGQIGKKAAFKAGMVGITGTATVDTLALGGADVARQYTEMEVNPEQRYDPLRTGTVAIATFGLSSIAQFSIAGVSGMFSKAAEKGVAETSKKGIKEITKTTPKTTKKLKPIEVKGGQIDTKIGSIASRWNYLKTNMFDSYDPVKNLQMKMTGTGGSVKDLNRAFQTQTKKSPMFLPYFQFRLTAASNARAEGMINFGVFFPSAKNAKNSSFTKGKSLPLLSKRDWKGKELQRSILGKFEDFEEINPFLEFVAAIHQKQILKNAKSKDLLKLQKQLKAAKGKKNIIRIQTKIQSLKAGIIKPSTEVPWNTNQINKAIDYGRLSPEKYFNKYKDDFAGISYQKYLKTIARKNDFDKGVKELKVFTNEMLEYSSKSEMISNSSVLNILKAYKDAWIPLTRSKKKPSFLERFKLKTTPIDDSTKEKIIVSKSPIKGLSKHKLEGDLNLLDNLNQYIHRTVSAADMNRAKVSMYEMFEAAHNSKKFGTIISDSSYKGEVLPGTVVRKITGADRITHMKATLESVQDVIEKQGLKISKKRDYKALKEKELNKIFKDENLDVMTFSGQIKKSGTDNYVDIVYRKNAKGEVTAEFYEILDENLHQMYKSFDLKTAKYLNRLENQLTGIGFVAEAIGTITRPFARGLGRAITYTPTFQARNFFRDTQAAAITSAFSIYNKGKVGFMPALTSGKGFANATYMNNDYRISIINGMGFATRIATEGIDQSPTRLIRAGKLDDFYNSQLKKMFGTSSKPGWIGRGAEAYKNFVSRTEYASRMGEFQLAKQAGFDDLGASFAGREVTTDFGMRGSSAILNSMARNTMFLNASMQGMYRGGRVLFEGTHTERAKAVGVISALVILPEASLYYLNRDNEEYNEISDIHKQLNHLIPINFKTDDRGNPVGTDFAAIPKPYDFGIFGNITHALLKGIDTRSTAISRKYLAQSIAVLSPVNWIGYIPATNTALEPILELMMNKDAFTGADVYRQYDELKMSDLRLKTHTREISVQVHNLTQFLKESMIPGSDDKFVEGTDPVTIDFLVNAYTVGIYKYGVDALDELVYLATGQKKYGEKPTLRTDEENIAMDPLSIFKKAFVIKSPLKSTQYYKIYTELVKEAKKVSTADISKYSPEKGMRVWKNLEEKVRERMKDGKSPVPKEVSIYKMVNANYLNVVDKKLKLINQHINNIPFIESSKVAARLGMSEGDYKRMKIDEALKARNELLKTVINKLANMDIPYIFEDTLGSKTHVTKEQKGKGVFFK
jgi:hypothetical protein